MALAVLVKAVFLLGLRPLRYYPFFIFGRWRPVDSLEEELVFVAPPIIHILITPVPIHFTVWLKLIMVLSLCDALRYKIRNLLEEVQF